MQDVITREIEVNAPQQRVYAAITDPTQIITWFPNVVSGGTFEVGQRPTFEFTNEKHQTSVYIEAVKPIEYFAYRWVPGGANSFVGDVLTVPNTLVEFFIEPTENGTRVTVKESGFAALPPEIAEQSFKDNSGGWEYMLSRLKKVMNQ